MVETMHRSKAIILGLSDSGEKIPAASGRISTQSGSATEIFAKSQDAEKNKNLIQKVTTSGHTSTIEHTVFNLAFENVSVFAEQFLIEFRLASFTVKSRRYVDFSDCGYYIPASLPKELRQKYIDHMNRLFADYGRLTDSGVAKEDARFILPYCLHSNFFCTVNARELLNMLKAMLYGRGARFAELQSLGRQLLEQAKELTPGITADFEARCESAAAPYFPTFSQEDTAPCDTFRVSLLSATPAAETLVCRAALLERGYSLPQADAIAAEENNQREILSHLLRAPRPRAWENANYTFRIEGISLACLTHFARHRMQSIQIPCLTEANRRAHVQPTFADAQCLAVYEKAFTDTLALYEELQQAGVDEETLVYTLLSGNLIDIVTTMNARELRLFFRLRCCTRAQWEIQEHANAMLQLCKQESPALFRGFGPSCVTDNCPEGRMCCGRQAEMREKYGANQ